MRGKSKIVAGALLTGIALLSMASAAGAACSIAGTWSFYAFEATAQGTQSHIIECQVTLAANGTFTGAACKSWQAGKSASESKTVHGTIQSTSCALSGSITIPGDLLVTIQSGHINSSSIMGAGIATQGTGNATRVLSFTLVKN